MQTFKIEFSIMYNDLEIDIIKHVFYYYLAFQHINPLDHKLKRDY
jgi:hypothetical protein